MALEVVKSRDDLQEFFEFLYADQSGYVYAPTKQEDEFKQYFFLWPNQKGELYTHIVSSTPTHDVYIAPALFKTDENAQKDNVKGTQVFWVEFDGTLPNDASLEGLPSPSVRIQSSKTGHEHWYWKLDEFIVDTKSIEQVNRGLTYKLGADTSGWDADQVLRPPKTINHKHGRPVSFVGEYPFISSPHDFTNLPAPPVLETAFNQDSLLDTAWIIARYEWAQSDFSFFRSREIPVGERSSAMMRLGYICAETGMQDQEIFSILYSADERWGKFRGRRDRIQRLNDIVSKVRIKYPVSLKNELDLDNLPVFGFNSFNQTDIEVEWVIPDLIQKAGSMLMSSKAGLGKTQLALNFAIKMGLGESFLHYDVTRPFKSVFFSLEMGHAELKYFTKQMDEVLSPRQRALLEENLKIVPLGQALYLDKELGQKAVEKIIQEYEPDGYFFDSLGSTTGDSLGDEKPVKLITDWDARLRQKYNIFSWFIHHNRKATAQNKKPRDLDDIFGSQYIAARATSAYILWRSKDDSTSDIEVINVKKRLAKMEAPYLINRSQGNLWFSESSVIRQAENDDTDYSFSNFSEKQETADSPEGDPDQTDRPDCDIDF